MINLARVKRKTYFDSITLMKLARSLSAMEGVVDAAAVMATPANLELLTNADLAPFTGLNEEPESDDVLIVVRADDEARARAALDEAEALLRSDLPHTSSRTMPREVQPRSLEEARRSLEHVQIALISVPGMYAALEAQQALLAGLHVFLFSDNVSLEDEVKLKRLARARDLLVMGPDCGTARWQGVGLGFANVVPDGPIGIIGASGTGMQQVMCLLAQAGYGISQAIGCGGRDLSAEVGGATTLQSLRLLQEDERTRVIVLISKPPAPQVAAQVLAEAGRVGKPVVAVFLNADPVLWQSGLASTVFLARTLTEAAQMASALCAASEVKMHGTRTHEIAHTPVHELETPTQLDVAPRGDKAVGPPYLAALFSGGTLCDEALHIWAEQLAPIYSNLPLKPDWLWRDGEDQSGHYALDLGADEYTRGRPHPMIDPEARLKYLRAAAAHPQVGVIALDIVLGYCAHPDPAAIYAPLIRESLQQARQQGRRLEYVISLCGTENDPQCLSLQEARLREAGAETFTSNAEAAEHCLTRLSEQRV